SGHGSYPSPFLLDDYDQFVRDLIQKLFVAPLCAMSSLLVRRHQAGKSMGAAGSSAVTLSTQPGILRKRLRNSSTSGPQPRSPASHISSADASFGNGPLWVSIPGSFVRG